MNNKLFIGIGGTGKSISPTKFVKYQKEKVINQIIFLTDDTEENDEQIRESDGETFHTNDSKCGQC